MAFKYNPVEFEKINYKYYTEMTAGKKFPSLPGFLSYAGISKAEYDLIKSNKNYAASVERYTNLRADYLMRGLGDPKTANGYMKLLSFPENGGYSDKATNTGKKITIIIKEFTDEVKGTK